MTTRGFGFVPDWGQSNTAPTRINKNAYFPVSISATVRAATFSETLAGILNAEPSHDIGDLETAFGNLDELTDKPGTAEELWQAFLASYAVSAKGFGTANEEPDYIKPFHRAVATSLKIDQRQWWRLYWLLMTDPEEGVNKELHDKFVEELFETPASNLLEQLVINAIEKLDEIDLTTTSQQTLENHSYHEIPPLVPECAEAFRTDLNAWLELKQSESTSRWMLGLQDLVCFHYMMYVLQVAVTLDGEYEDIQEGHPYEYEFSMEAIPFGLASERASQSRDFVKLWQKENGLSRMLYDSWGRLAIMSKLVDIGLEEETPVDDKPYTLTEALNKFPKELQERVVSELLAEFPEDQRPEGEYSLAEASVKFSHAVRRYYENMGRTPSSQTAYSAGENSVRDLGEGTERQYIERRQGVGTILRLDRGSLRLFARLFDATKERGHIDEFWEYMRQRGIRFDHRSKQTVITQLEGMGLLQKQSDSGEAMYVETV